MTDKVKKELRYISSFPVESSGQEHTTTKAKATLPVKANDFWSIDLFEGDIFGEEFLMGGITSTTERLTTAVAIANAQNDESVKLIKRKIRGATVGLQLSAGKLPCFK
ncbi:hypothetical protein P3T76_000418 [Phytophthora citrophthora]|uniref:Uncharacterized protein n=1 Tax=Phytophthora citrophthora TaxID=4793 RepID=A0AAD9LSP3_9STRA|nr:hypothetical protein P3T76_000418 [Phytophthora citrophthora]